MSMRPTNYGGPIKKIGVPTGSKDSYIFETVTASYNEDPSVVHGGVIIPPATENYKGIEIVNPPNIAHGARISIPPSVSGLIVEHGGPFENVQGKIVNDTQ
jgi:hypothetical protein